ncbi:MAG: pre-peptidase C-terminal domain-containing protein [Phycisphaerae bacterium]|nr:pre-peptidase C-terminal domain-containing protein [Phycisphaerae bacterium]
MIRGTASVIGLGFMLATLTGCPLITSTDGDDTPYLDESLNNSFKDATALPLSDAESLTFRGEISATNDFDVYSVGTLSAGDQLTVDVQATDGSLDPVLVVFDPEENLCAFSDDREEDGSDLNPYLDFIIRGDTGTYYIGITPYRGSQTTGEYEVAVTIQRGVGVPDPEPLVVFLDWDGAYVDNEMLGTYSLSAFTATDVGLEEYDTGALKDAVQDVIADRYDGYDVVLLNSDDDPQPTTDHSTVFFGGNATYAFALSEHIDVMNADKNDEAIVFTRSYEGAFSVEPTVANMGVAIGNTVAHELGHLLGLVHTSDCTSLMDSTCSNDALLYEQEFKRAMLDDSIFPIGYQDAAEFIGWLLGVTY